MSGSGTEHQHVRKEGAMIFMHSMHELVRATLFLLRCCHISSVGLLEECRRQACKLRHLSRAAICSIPSTCCQSQIAIGILVEYSDRIGIQ